MEVLATIESHGHLLRGLVLKLSLPQPEGSSRRCLLHHVTALNFAGYNFRLGEFDKFGGNYARAEMVKAFNTSDGYRKRFGR